MNKNSKIILHICCAVCGAYLVDLLKKNFAEVLLYFYNPNIFPKEEYERRKEAVRNLAEIYHLKLETGPYDQEKWFKEIKGLEKEPEGGKRCEICFLMRLSKTAHFAKEKNFEYFGTTLSISPYKNEKIIEGIGEKIAEKFNLNFLKLTDFQESKKEIWQKTRLLAREFNFYHQKYCGCLFSLKS